MKVTLIEALDPTSRIQAIKELRNASRDSAGRAMGLREAKEAVDALIDHGTPATVEIGDPRDLTRFKYVEDFHSRDLLLDFTLDVLSTCDPITAERIRSLPSYARVAEALR